MKSNRNSKIMTLFKIKIGKKKLSNELIIQNKIGQIKMKFKSKLKKLLPKLIHLRTSNPLARIFKHKKLKIQKE
jgi:hypothetical protein